ncbi:MAG: hypothetical protein ACTHLB_05475 [Parafilimonas sp.]
MLKETAEVLNEEKYGFYVAEAKRGLFFKKKTVKKLYHIPQLNLFTMIRISKEVVQMDTDILNKGIIDAGMKALDKSGESLIRIIAYAVLNGDAEPSKELLKGLSNMTADDLLQIIGVVLKQMNLKSFMTSIISITGVNVIEMNPKEQGS